MTAQPQIASEKLWLKRAVDALQWGGLDIDYDTWAEVATLTERLKDHEIAKRLIAAAQAQRWLIGGRALAALARLCSMLALYDEFACVLNGCQNADWPLSEDDWAVLLTASERLGVESFKQQIMVACDARDWNLSSAGWSHWVRLTRLQGGDWTDRALRRLAEQVPRFPVESLSEILETLREMRGTSDKTRRTRLLSIMHRIVGSRDPQDWTLRGNVEFMVRIALQWRDLTLMESILPALHPDQLSPAFADNIIAFTISYYRLADDEAAAIQAAKLLERVKPAFQSDEIALLRIRLLHYVLETVGALPLGGASIALPSEVERLSLKITDRDFKVVAIAVDRTSLNELLGDFEQSMSSLANVERTAFRNKLRALLRLLGGAVAGGASLLQLGRMYRRAHDYPGALDLFEQAAALAKDDKNKSIATKEIGSTLLAQGRAEEALLHLRRSVESIPTPDPGTVAKTAEAARRSGNYAVATEILEDYINARIKHGQFSLHAHGRAMLQPPRFDTG